MAILQEHSNGISVEFAARMRKAVFISKHRDHFLLVVFVFLFQGLASSMIVKSLLVPRESNELFLLLQDVIVLGVGIVAFVVAVTILPTLWSRTKFTHALPAEMVITL